MSELLHKAVDFATVMHNGQDRKYIGLPYITHPLAVMEIVRGVTDDENMLAAAVLHDVVEDTPCSIDQIAIEFGADVAGLVYELTDVSKPEDGNREVRKAIDRKRLGKVSDRAKTIKLADLIHNSGSIVEHGSGFADVYMREKSLLLSVLSGGDLGLLQIASDIVFDYCNSRELKL